MATTSQADGINLPLGRLKRHHDLPNKRIVQKVLTAEKFNISEFSYPNLYAWTIGDAMLKIIIAGLWCERLRMTVKTSYHLRHCVVHWLC